MLQMCLWSSDFDSVVLSYSPAPQSFSWVRVGLGSCLDLQLPEDRQGVFLDFLVLSEHILSLQGS